MNKNDNPLASLSDLINEIDYANFAYKKHFRHLCNIKADLNRERMGVEAISFDKIDISGLVYVFVIGGKIFKIGHTITGIEGRVQSYNCGKKKNRGKGTCSTTNYFVLQSVLNIQEDVQVYAYFPNVCSYEIFGEPGTESFPSPKAVEKKIIKDFTQQHGKKPIGCIQR